jgi:signal transduction histidine kinase/ActR/RegA family two-component response regulator
MEKEKNTTSKTALNITFIYSVLGLLFAIFMSNSDKGFLNNIFLGISFVVLTSIVFYFLIGMFLKKEIKSDEDAAEKDETYKEKYDAMYQEKVQAEIMNSAKSQFLTNMSQEIRIPMSGIIGMTELMMLTNVNKEQKEYLDIINFSSSTLLAIINDILDFSRIESGKLKLENIEFSIKDLVHKTTQILDFEAKRKNLQLKLDISKDINYNVYGDPLRINQILINLTKNAVKYTDTGTVSISLSEASKNNSEAKLKIAIKDTGKGFDKDIIEKLFGIPDETGKIKLTKDFQYTGIGFGIPIIRHLVALMEGEMFLHTEPGKGSDISINIPFKFSSEEASKTAESITAEGVEHHEEKPHDQTNILVAEDNIVNQRLVKELLVRKNYKVTIVENGLKIFDVLESTRFDAILMDIQMPIMDGLEATSIIREIEKGTGKHIPIIGITAYAVKADKEKCISAGMDDYMSKPFVKEEFYSMIEKYTANN